jgi:hypothetical protein
MMMIIIIIIIIITFSREGLQSIFLKYLRNLCYNHCCRNVVKGFWEIGTSSIYCVLFLPHDADRLQSPKRRVSFIKDRRWIMSRKFVILSNSYGNTALA